MDRHTYAQLDRMEGLLNHIKELSQFQISVTSTEVLQDFYEVEIQSEDGKLHHLLQDEKTQEFFKEIVENNTPNKDEEKEKEYKQNE